MEKIIITFISNGKEQTIKLEKEEIKITDMDYIFLEMKGDIEEGLETHVADKSELDEELKSFSITELEILMYPENRSKRISIAAKYGFSDATVARRIKKLLKKEA